MRLVMFLGIHLLVTIVLNGTRPVVSLYADAVGASVAEIGMLVSAYAFLPMLLAIKIGKILDRIGSKKLTLYGVIGMIISVSAPILFPSYYALLFTQLIMGCSVICCLISMQKTIGNLNGNRDKLIASFTLFGSIGELIGPIKFSFLYEHFGIRYTFGFGIILLLIIVCILMILPKSFWGKPEKSKPSETTNTLLLLKNKNLLKAIIVSGLVISSKDLFVAYFPVYGTSVGLRPSTIGMILSICAAAAVLIRLLQFQLVLYFGRGILISATLLFSAVSFILIPLFSNVYALLLISILLGLGLGLGQPLSLVYAMNVSEPRRHGEVLGLRLTFNRVSQFLSPFLFGGFGSALGISSLFFFIGIFMFTGTFFTRLKEDEPSSEKKDENKVGMR
ncbi:MFS transporter [Oceanobacillus jeddahense]|uniref:MFS transporter n=1 Tax=Oceanobacillus jeddahense TaxID=1462527 RepID=A0ABY5JQ46_9BACI|nr:MFS transporter [Oceanobacillus jeddahense]UUI02435.1 MFS transporter [Oceanobacillus jeddahense]